MRKTELLLEAVAEEHRDYVRTNLNRSYLLRKHNGDIQAAADEANNQARMMKAIDPADDAYYARLKAGVSPAFDMRTGTWVD
jgi:hypothetical protein